MSKRVKKRQNTIAKNSDNEGYRPQYLKFNFTYIVHDENLEDRYIVDLFNRMRFLSSVPFTQMLNYNKRIGFEFELIDIKKQIPQKFVDRFGKKADEKYAIFRIYSNNQPVVARVIGIIIEKVMYTFFIDIGGNLYKH